MFFCESALEAQRAGTRAAANKSKNTRGSSINFVLSPQTPTADATHGNHEGLDQSWSQ